MGPIGLLNLNYNNNGNTKYNNISLIFGNKRSLRIFLFFSRNFSQMWGLLLASLLPPLHFTSFIYRGISPIALGNFQRTEDFFHNAFNAQILLSTTCKFHISIESKFVKIYCTENHVPVVVNLYVQKRCIFGAWKSMAGPRFWNDKNQ